VTTHRLKTWPEFFDAIADGRKTFEIRKNDRGFQTGDELVLLKWDPSGGTYFMGQEGRTANPNQAASLRVRVTYVLSGWGIEPFFVVLGLQLIEVSP
jgi:hypothetical protein